MSELTHQRCPHKDCGSSNAFSWNSDKSVGKCFSCDKGYPIKGGDYCDWAADTYPLKEIDLKPSKQVFGSGFRGIMPEIEELYGVATFANASGDVVEQHYTYPSGNKKIRVEPKAFRCVGSVAGELWGADKFPKGVGRRITIVEGEVDAMSAYQMLNAAKTKHVNPVVSLPSATPSEEFWTNTQAYLDGFATIVLSVDTDGPGNAIADRICALFPANTLRVDHGTLKDANEYLEAGKQEDYISQWFNAPIYTPANIFTSKDDFMKLWDESESLEYVPTGVAELDDKIMGIIPGHLYMFKAKTGIGKSEFMRYLQHNLFTKGHKFAACHLEETKLRTLLGLTGYYLNRNVTRKDIIEAQGLESVVVAALEEIAEKGLYYQFSLRENETTESLCSLIRLLSVGYGCRFIFVEPAQDILNSINHENRESELAKMGVALSKLAAELNIAILSVAHENDDGEIKYCRFLGQRASVTISLQRDKESDDPLTRNTTNLYIEKNRPTSLEGAGGSMLFELDKFVMKPIDE